jgi:hypothetical protein
LAVESWGPDRLDIFALGKDFDVWHKAWAQGWFPSQMDWELIGGERGMGSVLADVQLALSCRWMESHRLPRGSRN